MQPRTEIHPQPDALVGARVGGWALVLAAALFMAVFSWLAARFNYPDVLEGAAADVLPQLLLLGDTGRAVWALYALLPLLLIPAGVGAYLALRRNAPARMQVALLLAVVSAVAMMLGLMRWPTMHWVLAQSLSDATSAGERAIIAALFDSFNLYLGNYLGEFVGELVLNGFFLMSALAMREDVRFPRWAGPTGIVAALLGLVAMWRNVTTGVALVAEIENYALPLWMIGQGVLLARLQHTAVREV